MRTKIAKIKEKYRFYFHYSVVQQNESQTRFSGKKKRERRILQTNTAGNEKAYAVPMARGTVY